MSLLHNIMFNVMLKHKPVYDPQNKPNYAQRRAKEESGVKEAKPPKKVSLKEISLNGIHAEEYTKPGNSEKAMVMYIHGGGFVTGSAKNRRMAGLYICDKLGFDVVSIDYRLAPEHPFPAAPEDCFTAYKAALKQYAGRKLILMGESAGGNLVLVVGLLAKDAGIELPFAIVPFSPTVQCTEVLESYKKNEASDCMLTLSSIDEVSDSYFSGSHEQLTNVMASPLMGDLSGFPPTYLVASSCEMLLDDSVLFDKKLRESGCESKLVLYPKMMHAFMMIPLFPETRREYKNIKKWLDEKLGE